jgi:hypothetical protein
VVAGTPVLAETSTLGTGSNPVILVLLGDRLRPVTREDIRSIQALQQTPGTRRLSEFIAHSAPAAAELVRSAEENEWHQLLLSQTIGR